MTRFRPCIDLHAGVVKQIVGGTLADGAEPRTNFVSTLPPAHYAALYRRDGLTGGHVIMLGPGNEAAARAALAAWPGGLQVGGGISIDNAASWLDAGAEKIIVTSWLFPEGRFAPERLQALSRTVGHQRLVIDLSCRRRGYGWVVAIQRWQRLTDTVLDGELFARLSEHCSEFLVHAADVEGLCRGIDPDLVECLGRWSPLPVTYAGGARDFSDLALVEDLSEGRVDLTIGSALDLFGGCISYAACVAWNRERAAGACTLLTPQRR